MKVIPIKASCGFNNGFEQLASTYKELGQTLDSIVMPNKVATFIGLASGDSMQSIGLFDGDLIIVDRAVDVKDGDVIVANLNGEFVCKILDYKNGILISASDQYKPVVIKECGTFSFEGVVTSSVRIFRRKECFKSKLF